MKPFKAIMTAGAALLCMLVVMPANAALVDIDKGSFHDSVFVLGSDLHLTDFHTSTAGMVTLQLTDIGWTDLLQSLSANLSEIGKTILTQQGSGRLSFDMDKDDTFSLAVYAVAGGARKYGLYSLDCEFTPGAAQVPLPAAGLLLASGLGLLPALRRRRRKQPAPMA